MLVAIVGRPNVGKSTFFNRLTESRQAIVNEESGVTRDRQYGKFQWNGKEMSLIDTGGYIKSSDDVFEEEIAKQVRLAIDEADCILFVVDVMSGLTDLDESVAELLRRSNKPVLIVVNKVDNNNLQYAANEFYSLGYEHLFCLSSLSGSGTGEVLDFITNNFTIDEIKDDSHIPKIAVVGRPNVGKSSIINCILGEDRSIVTSISGTTRDSIETKIKTFGLEFKLVDTAGLRKKAKVNEDIEFYSTMRSVRAIEGSNVCMLVIDAERGVESQDLSILRVILKNGKGLVVVVNKWDLIEKETNTMRDYIEFLKEAFKPFTDFPVIFTSATTKQRVIKAFETAIEVNKNISNKISTSKLNEKMLEFIEAFPPPTYKGKYIKIKYCTQLPTKKTSFAFFCNLPQYIKDPYKRYLENKMRETFNLIGIPFEIYFRKK